jgi:hypothetical protein
MARAQSVLGAVYFLSVLAMASPALASEPAPVVVGEVVTRVQNSGTDLPKELRSSLEREVANLALRQVGRHQRFVLSASLVKLEHQVVAGSESVSCTVSIVLREQKSGAIRAILEGRARAQGNDGESVVVDAAARAALASLPDALR